ncbi:hypothetical protein FHX34_10249 [Actinoplanes teichomyceticus]|uniref:Uncharacterized protein n=1 Tax=Actinoplanes teichomyceticus TaxID=1867 RepID=A0A561WI07_ACTTI|nr:hypothetical protein FHX34_10249 [Actinoplanes teichomyceticus]GIF16127.1 hypothetical protein Ate01nite_61590 [Actinoplanes teichomyceticus]
MTRTVRSRRAGAAHQPLYSRMLRLRHLSPSGLLCFVFLEGAIALGILLALAELVSWWGVLVLPLAVAVMVKFNDLVAGWLAPPAAAAEPVAARVAVQRGERYPHRPRGGGHAAPWPAPPPRVRTPVVTPPVDAAQGRSTAVVWFPPENRYGPPDRGAEPALDSPDERAEAYDGRDEWTGGAPGGRWVESAQDDRQEWVESTHGTRGEWAENGQGGREDWPENGQGGRDEWPEGARGDREDWPENGQGGQDEWAGDARAGQDGWTGTPQESRDDWVESPPGGRPEWTGSPPGGRDGWTQGAYGGRGGWAEDGTSGRAEPGWGGAAQAAVQGGGVASAEAVRGEAPHGRFAGAEQAGTPPMNTAPVRRPWADEVDVRQQMARQSAARRYE